MGPGRRPVSQHHRSRRPPSGSRINQEIDVILRFVNWVSAFGLVGEACPLAVQQFIDPVDDGRVEQFILVCGSFQGVRSILGILQVAAEYEINEGRHVVPERADYRIAARVFESLGRGVRGIERTEAGCQLTEFVVRRGDLYLVAVARRVSVTGRITFA